MPRFTVVIQEIHTASVSVSADDEAQAREEAAKMINENDIETSYDYTCDQEDWPVTLEKH